MTEQAECICGVGAQVSDPTCPLHGFVAQQAEGQEWWSIRRYRTGYGLYDPNGELAFDDIISEDFAAFVVNEVNALIQLRKDLREAQAERDEYWLRWSRLQDARIAANRAPSIESSKDEWEDAMLRDEAVQTPDITGPGADYFLQKRLEWLQSNEKKGDEVRWGGFPLGMVRGWIECAEAAERRAEEAEQALANSRHDAQQFEDEADTAEGDWLEAQARAESWRALALEVSSQCSVLGDDEDGLAFTPADSKFWIRWLHRVEELQRTEGGA